MSAGREVVVIGGGVIGAACAYYLSRAGWAVTVLERGDISFAYRPRIDAPAAHGFDDVQRLYMILSPPGSGSHRLIIIGEKRLPVSLALLNHRSLLA